MYAEFILPEETNYMTAKQYIEYKTKVLYQLGMTDHIEVKAHLERKSANAETDLKKKIQIDNAARTIMMDFYDGDMTFVKVKRKAKQYLEILKNRFPKAETLYEDTIIKNVGRCGLQALREEHLIETCALLEGRKLYAI